LGGSTLGPWLKGASPREQVGVTSVGSKGEVMACRRLVGIDLGIVSAHAVRVLDEAGNTVAKRKAVPTVESLATIESSALEGTPAGTRWRW
jgi:hypothetical protein